MASNEQEHSSEDILNDALFFLGGKSVIEDEIISYGPVKLTVAPKEGKANTLLADHLFSPSLFLAEQLERGLIPLQGKTLIELGAGCSLPSLASCIISSPSNVPSLVVTSDYPDPIILGNLRSNVERNRALVSPMCKLHYRGYEWGQDIGELLTLLPVNHSTSAHVPGFDIVILSDLLHFNTSHDALVKSLSLLLAKTEDARVYVAAGRYTLPSVCSSFLQKATDEGLIFEEDTNHIVGANSAKWLGTLSVTGLDAKALSLRKNNCRYWVGRWMQPQVNFRRWKRD
ncbi:hypothetical protein J3R30DRAFT_3304462 [Lentinula aciculospora]|uniref:Uncharacterized protein n=1 Tax=Lentinula aciculospora TaxID=153920 RepID=A0A9W8ZWG3_9AGAR|nr:hypothetical protein J3R30DRAFT_3304462 [Lentinula aciculospora]